MNAAQVAKRPPGRPIGSGKPRIAIDPARGNHAIQRLRATIETGQEHDLPYPPAVANALLRLTIKQRRFTLARACGYSLTGAYRAAYDVKAERPDSDIYTDAANVELTTDVAMALTIVNSWMDADWLLDMTNVRQFTLSKLYDKAEHGKKDSDQLVATKLLMQAHGLLVNKTEVTIRDGDKADSQAAVIEALLGQIGVIDATFHVEHSDNELSIGAQALSINDLHVPIVGIGPSADTTPHTCGACYDYVLRGEGEGV